MEPCGTPARVSRKDELEPWITMRCLGFSKITFEPGKKMPFDTNPIKFT